MVSGSIFSLHIHRSTDISVDICSKKNSVFVEFVARDGFPRDDLLDEFLSVLFEDWIIIDRGFTILFLNRSSLVSKLIICERSQLFFF